MSLYAGGNIIGRLIFGEGGEDGVEGIFVYGVRIHKVLTVLRMVLQTLFSFLLATLAGRNSIFEVFVRRG